MEMMLQLFLLALGFVMLVKGADWFVDGSSAIARRFGIPQLVVGLTIVAMGTSAPEAAVSLAAAVKGNADITIGNIVGSNILNILIILGVSSLLTDLQVAKSTIRAEIPFMLGITAVLMLLGNDGVVGRGNGLVLLLLFALYLAYLFRMAQKGREEIPEATVEQPLGRCAAMTVIGLVLIVWGSNVTVDAATALARLFGMSERFIGLTIVALGTSLPELFTSVNAAMKDNADIAIGNIVGSNIFNILFVVGLSGVILPVHFADLFIVDTLIAMAAAALLGGCCLKKEKLVSWHGVVMLVIYGAYLGWLLMK
ncbi:MAG: calcium/sodium antiporter [Oscillospiraceae bacterium]|nr:calcium/sodium antiporter [Oscillospiraceae bacterium]